MAAFRKHYTIRPSAHLHESLADASAPAQELPTE